MSERKFGTTYFEVLNAIKDSIDNEISFKGKQLDLPDEQIRLLVTVASNVVDNIGGSAFRTLYKSAE